MIFLRNDYSEGAHPKILTALSETNNEQHLGYGEDTHTLNACARLREQIGCLDADVHLLVGGTQVNKIVTSAFLRPFEAVVAASSAHIAVHEAGAIENGGHKIIACPTSNGKLTVEELDYAVQSHKTEHMVHPKMVYISNATELGTVYSKDALETLSCYCKKHDLYFYIDGARLPNALTASGMCLKELAELCDAFYLGGTKNGAMFGEALVILNPQLKNNMRFYMKQHGALLAKGRFLGIQFDVLLQDNLIFSLAQHANAMAQILAEGLKQRGFAFLADVDSNMIFLLLPQAMHKELAKHCHYEIEFVRGGKHVEARFVTSFATTKEEIEAFLTHIDALLPQQQ